MSSPLATALAARCSLTVTQATLGSSPIGYEKHDRGGL
eukprot:CAMPEP_0177556626 /NCGR_PEP_ID=MMETSP0369-20130122/69178_1 /TAXON_ID=447022 ORGANISM="Scrippsiella hangoei-like, Strain SHHI-4" /NCGR_SAMPLE_ID=MMETSP0369 /ASSEMBLY_ACC=CAM_ASM_000364 /LENGTH=37 /DNA_ID= /DNA_START= /DNA_END= /DNA_ORIENTATION=